MVDTTRRFLCMAGIFLIIALFVNYAAVAATYRAGNDCEDSVEYQPSGDVNYEPGVDAEGWAIAPAEINPPTLTADDFKDTRLSIDVPTTKYLDQKKYNVDLSETDIQAGQVSVHIDGSVKMNGKELAPKSVIGNCK